MTAIDHSSWIDVESDEFDSATRWGTIISGVGITIPLTIDSLFLTVVVTAVLLAVSSLFLAALVRDYRVSHTDSVHSYLRTISKSISTSSKIGLGLMYFGAALTLLPQVEIFVEYYAFLVVNTAIIFSNGAKQNRE